MCGHGGTAHGTAPSRRGHVSDGGGGEGDGGGAAVGADLALPAGGEVREDVSW